MTVHTSLTTCALPLLNGCNQSSSVCNRNDIAQSWFAWTQTRGLVYCTDLLLSCGFQPLSLGLFVCCCWIRGANTWRSACQDILRGGGRCTKRTQVDWIWHPDPDSWKAGLHWFVRTARLTSAEYHIVRPAPEITTFLLKCEHSALKV